MKNFILTYHGGKKPETADEGAKHMAEWEKWADSLGDSLVNRGTPLGSSKSVTTAGVVDGGGDNPMVGYSIVCAENIEAAVQMVENSPHVTYGGMMVVAEMMEMKGC